MTELEKTTDINIGLFDPDTGREERFREEMNEAIRQAVNIYNNGRGTYSDIKRQTPSSTS